METKEEPTVERSLEVLSEALGKASVDLCAVRAAVDLARFDLLSHNGSHKRAIIRDTERAITHLRETDESLRDVVSYLRERE